MKLSMESWVEQQKFNVEIRKVFEEAFKCYKASACRAALQFSYLGFALCLRERIFKSDKPEPCTDVEWDRNLNKLRDDETWDSHVFDLANMSHERPKKVFLLSDDLRRQLQYWKDRRNDCAHFKANEIGVEHVESFWSFLRSNLGHFVPINSEDGLLEKINNHYDINKTALGTSVDYLIDKIPQSVKRAKFEVFLSKVKDLFTTSSTSALVGDTVDIYKLTDFIEACFKLDDDFLKDAVIKLILKGKNYRINYLREHPNRVSILTGKEELVRELWKTKLFARSDNDYPLFCALIRNELIPEEQLEEAITRAVSYSKSQLPNSDIDYELLKNNNFEEEFVAYYFTGESPHIGNYMYSNSSANFIAYMMRRITYNSDIVKMICDGYENTSYHPLDVSPKLKKMYEENPTKAGEFKAIATANEFELPSILFPDDEPVEDQATDEDTDDGCPF